MEKETNMQKQFLSFLFSVRNPEGRIRLYCKGADTVLLERLHPCNQEVMSITSDHLNVSQLLDGWLELHCHLESPHFKTTFNSTSFLFTFS